ncbi:MAG TPA: histidine phosphatase family protein [Negativicutes bacterium]|nr:histidine phosphatase family protein [Negativicutes bacterium]
MITIFFIRHGQTLWNKEFKYQGHSDIELSEEGLQQANRVALRLRREPFSAIYSSDLSRAVVTAEKVAQYHSLPVVPMSEFREVGFGEWEGLKYDQICAGWSAEIEKFFRFPSQVEIPGGESFHGVQKRTNEGLEVLRQRHDGECIAVVTHGGAIRTMLCSALGIPLDSLWSFRQDNTAVNIVEYEERKNILRLVNDVNHLYDFESLDPNRLPSYNINKIF